MKNATSCILRAAAILLTCISTSLIATELPLRLKATIAIHKPAFLELDRKDVDEPYRLIVSGFTVFGSDHVTVINNLVDELDRGTDNIKTTVWTTKVTWPNETSRMPKSVMGEGYFTIAGGFLVPGKSNGEIVAFNPETGKHITLSNKKSGYFYHQVTWADMNNNGRLDILTARATKPLIGAGKGELLWLEQPQDATSGAWKEHIIGAGPDVNFIYEDLDGSGQKVVLATEYFGAKLSLWWQEGNFWRSRVVDRNLGAGFDLEFVDLNRDGRKDILATNHEGGASKAAVFAYEIPANIRTDVWKRHTLLGNIRTTSSGMNQASPGSARSFFPYANQKGGKPHIIVAGDGSQKTHLLIPMSQRADDWEYHEQVVMKVNKGVIGQIAVGDIDGDGRADIFIPAYDENKIYVYSVE